MSYDFADRLIEMRRSRGLSQEELAKDLGLSRQAISKWERAESAPDIGNLVALANIYEVTLDELVRGVDEVKAAEVEVDVVGEGVSAEDAVEAVETAEVVEAVEDPATVEVVETVETDGATTPTETVDAAADATSPSSQTVSSDGATMPPPPPGAVPVQIPMEAPAQPRKQRNPLYTFPYALLVALIYLVLGFCFGLWHPCWVIFLTIPFYYWIASVITHDPEFEEKHRQYYGPRDADPHGHRGPYPE